MFLPPDREGAQRVVVISRRMADVFWPGEDPVGRPIQIGSQPAGVVVGIVANVRSQTLATAAQPEMHVPHAQSGQASMMYVIKSSLGTAQVLGASREVVKQLDARLPLIGPSSMQDVVEEQLARPRFYLVLIGLFAVLSVVLAAIGIYGVVAYVVATHARSAYAQALARARVSGGLDAVAGLRPAAVGMAIGLVAAIGGAQLIRGLLHEVRPHDPMTFVAVSMGLLLVVVIACAIPARRASGVAPAEALRGE